MCIKYICHWVKDIWITKIFTSPRQYPAGLGDALLRLHQEVKGKPQFDLRQKVPIDPSKTDLQVFRGLPDDDDSWVDAQLPNVFIYLYQNEKLRVPNEWDDTMREMFHKMKQLVPWLQLVCVSHVAL